MRQHVIWLNEIQQKATYGTITEILRAARCMLMYRHAAKMSMELRFTIKKPEHQHYKEDFRLQDILSPIDYVPDSFDTPSTKEIRAQVPQ